MAERKAHVERLFSMYLRRARGILSQAEMGERTGGITQSAWARRESGKASLSEEALRSTAHALGLGLEEWLLGQLALDEQNAVFRQALRKAEKAARARREAGEQDPPHILARVLTNARLAHGIGQRAFRAKVPGVDRALSQGSEVREQTVEKAAAVLGLTVHEVLREGLLFDPKADEGDLVDRPALRARLSALMALQHPEASQRVIAEEADIHESNVSRFRRCADDQPDVLSEDSARRLDKAVAELERKLKPEPKA